MAKAKPQLDHDKNGKAGGAKAKAFTYKPVCGMSQDGFNAFLDEAEGHDKGTERYPWPKGLKAEITEAVSGMAFIHDVQVKVNEIVVAKGGPGLFNRGPFKMPGDIV